MDGQAWTCISGELDREWVPLKRHRKRRYSPSNTVPFFQELRSDVGSGISRDTSDLQESCQRQRNPNTTSANED